MDEVADVDIEADGVFKYILIKLSDKKKTGASKVIVRGYSWADYHGKQVNRGRHACLIRSVICYKSNCNVQ